MLTKKDFCAVAAIITDQSKLVSVDNPEFGAGYHRAVASIADDLARLFASSNPRFDRSRFLAACKVAS